MPCEARCSPGNLVLAERLSSRSRPRVKTCGADVRRRRRRPLHRSSVELAAVSESCCRDLLVVGPGVLGSLVCQRWLKVRALASSRRSRVRRARSTTDLDPRRFFSIVSQQNASEFVSLSLTRRSNGHAQTFPAATVIGQTNTDASHERLVALGISPRLKADAGESRRFPFVVFSAPPSGSDDYTAEVEAALKLWDGTGGFVFTSSTAVYAGKDGEDCDETTAQFQIGESPRADKLLNAEAAVLGAGGCVVRLSGLYHSQRGAHMYFLKTPTLASRPDALVRPRSACPRDPHSRPLVERTSRGGSRLRLNEQ